MTNDDKHKHVKVVDVEKIDEQDDEKNGPVDTVDIFDDVTGEDNGEFRPRNKRQEDIENPLSDEDRDVVGENLFTSEPDKGEPE
ncbi:MULTISPECIES: hypothetical protein [Bartonella]|uniref:Uncharacterized protein n=1 Tax=Bartonella choladocola TaxID=2750995 RepID=A0A1U9MG53_9HYPH|nr:MULTISPECIES: hypothetical protein [Bartonella]AQT46690.1 hypothetical protein BBC0122_005600 [Bartonella choladocola]MBH9974296.1 hypothetical protein [Bartonella choladocola]MBI0013903.1 hypothetical protein [Bartonella sp. B10834G3]MBI0140049.1 hypothetical protein [Bartonella choladocola]